MQLEPYVSAAAPTTSFFLGGRAFRTPPILAMSVRPSRNSRLGPSPAINQDQEPAPARPLGFSGNARHCLLAQSLRAGPRANTFCFVSQPALPRDPHEQNAERIASWAWLALSPQRSVLDLRLQRYHLVSQHSFCPRRLPWRTTGQPVLECRLESVHVASRVKHASMVSFDSRLCDVAS